MHTIFFWNTYTFIFIVCDQKLGDHNTIIFDNYVNQTFIDNDPDTMYVYTIKIKLKSHESKEPLLSTRFKSNRINHQQLDQNSLDVSEKSFANLDSWRTPSIVTCTVHARIVYDSFFCNIELIYHIGACNKIICKFPSRFRRFSIAWLDRQRETNRYKTYGQ